MNGPCFCGCWQPAVHEHHAIVAQRIKREGGNPDDPRWLVPVGFICHMNHHARAKPYKAARLPDQVFEVARETFGPGRAFNELSAAYADADPRLDLLLKEADGGDDFSEADSA